MRSLFVRDLLFCMFPHAGRALLRLPVEYARLSDIVNMGIDRLYRGNAVGSWRAGASLF
ncbi:hypothetical protein K9U40_17090 [Xanthobacter autotrophicus]|uniref:hypothetical protein n=1 Tax=Xanthobacter TaxID=279 RepID=UPI0024AB35BE|nr:hypothetical protein [Xanthobacter autotrophicus]MDI4666024.1 hypothetical protein [Xanthobacter autotrophicus]